MASTTTTSFPFETSEPKVEVTLPVGRHTLQLVVEDSAGLRSVPATVVIEVKRVIPTLTIPTLTQITPTLTKITPTFTKPTLPTSTIPTMTAMASTLPLSEPSLITRGENTAGKTSLTMVKGVTSEAAGKLAAAGIADAETLANATPEKVAATLGIENANALTLIGEADKTVKK